MSDVMSVRLHLSGVRVLGVRVDSADRLDVRGRRTTLVWRRRPCCDNCGERHLEDHYQFQAGLTQRFGLRLARDARMMSIRAVALHHGEVLRRRAAATTWRSSR